MKIYTTTGDGGMTALFGAGKVYKDDLRVEVYGDVDTLNAVIGVAMAHGDSEAPWHQDLARVQSMLFELGGELATPDPEKRRSGILADDALWLESCIDALDASLPPLTSFVMPGGTVPSAALHHARCVCRQAERRLVTLLREVPDATEHGLVFLNRLSDYLFVVARASQARVGASDIPWQPR